MTPRPLALLLAGALACGRHAEEAAAPSAPARVPGVETAIVDLAPVRDVVEGFATVAVTGEPPEVRDARAALAEAEARRRLAGQQLGRLEALAQGAVAPRKELDAARAEAVAAEVAVARARQVLAAFGSVAAEGPAADETGGETAVIVRVLQQDMARVQVGAPVTLTPDALPEASFSGRVAAAAAYVDPATHLAPVSVRVHDPEHALRPGMTAAARIEVGAPRPAVLVPAAAVVYDEAQPLVFVEEAAGRFSARPVRLGVLRDGQVEVASGLPPGTRVATTGAASLLSATRLPAAGGE